MTLNQHPRLCTRGGIYSQPVLSQVPAKRGAGELAEEVLRENLPFERQRAMRL